ncbi:hypothetical protein [Candidatus Magnetominusculus xianensis]|uniref:SMODS-associating 2TM beta-strand rich effector domain-containing protein n=1 Tax=Candidatus Magnetominusculus xianensis TaxID=1748249 RepID=A0ABR5SGZ4_9BACT|nr:hypothetical protein [Candidatus Magnetominusculus xianensis]KWT85939.1 hypothetical protein ASN18_1650 [Candidatus Magnetominusculus xianensis]MBF0403612.1 hypothetical protein [Nitrospirota bacterium]
MELLAEFYKKALRGAFILVAILAFLVGDKIGKDYYKYITSGAALFFILVELFINKILWKIWHGNLNISDEWEAITKYEKSIGIYPNKECCLVQSTKESQHKTIFKQDCVTLAIELSGGQDFPHFYSLAIEMIKDKTALRVRYAYKVDYINSKLGCPQDTAYGYEEMAITEYEELKGWQWFLKKCRIIKAKPSRMTGRFWHCARECGNAYIGTVEFWRNNKP